MPDDPADPATDLAALASRVRCGDAPAREAFARALAACVDRVVRRMLRRFPNVSRWEDASDVAQEAIVRIIRAVEGGDHGPRSAREFESFAAVCVRTTLLDLARRYRGVRAPDLHPGAVGPADSSNPVTAAAGSDDDLGRWTAFHDAVERLPTAEREVVGLKFYHGWTNQDVGDLLGVSERMVRKHWDSARRRLSQALGGDLPGE